MTKSLTIIVPVNWAQTVNDFLESAGYGPDNLSTPMRTIGSTYATHVATHWWATDAQLTDIRTRLIATGLSESLVDNYMNSNTIESGTIAFGHLNGRKSEFNLEQPDIETWIDPPIMLNDTVVKQGKTWQSLIDFNVYDPASGFKWVQI